MTVYRNTIETDTSDSVQSLNQLSNAAESTTDRVARLDRQADQLGDRAGKTASAAGMLGGVLGRINPEFEEGARVVADLADGLDVASMMGGRMLAILGPVGVAAGVAAGAYLILKNNLDAANAAMEQAAEKANRMVDVHRKVKEAALLAALAEGEITQERFDSIVAAQNAADVYRDLQTAQREQLKTAQDELDQMTASRDALRDYLRERRQYHQDTESFTRLFSQEIAQLQAYNSRIDELTHKRNAEATALGNLNVAQANYASSLETIATAQHATTQAHTAASSAVSELAEEVFGLAEAFEALGFAAPGDDLVGIGIDLNAPLTEMNTNLTQGLDLLSRQIEVRQRLAELAERSAAATEAERQALISQRVASVETAGAAIQVAGGNLGAVQGLLPAGGAAAAMANPILGVLAGLEQIGAMGSEGVEARLDMMLENVSAGIRALPSILIDVIPEFVFALVTELPAALADAIGEVFRRLFNLIPGVDIQEPGEGQKSVLQQLFSDEGIVLYTKEQGFGIAKNNPDMVGSASRSAAASTRGRMERADGATRLAMSRAPTSTMFGSGATIIQQALGFDSGSQDRFQRRFSQLTNAETGLRGRT